MHAGKKNKSSWKVANKPLRGFDHLASAGFAEGHHSNSLVVLRTVAEDRLESNFASDQDHAFRTVVPPHQPTCSYT